MNTSRRTAAWITVVALGLAPAPGACFAEAPASAESAPPSAAPAPAAEATTTSPHETASPIKAPATTGRKPLTREAFLELPVFKRLDIPWEKGEALLADVKDNTFGYDEEAFWWLVAQVNKLPPEKMKPDDECVAFSHLLAMPTTYRGQPVTLRGVYMTVTPFRTPLLALRKDVPTLYACNLREEPMEQERLVATVIVIDDPMTYIKAFDNVRVKGYFYKIREYQGTKGTGYSPMLVARRIELEEAAPVDLLSRSGPGLGNQATLAVAFAALLALGAAFFVVRYLATRGKARATSQRPIHKFRLRRPDRVEPPAGGGPGGQGGGPKP